MKRLMARIRSLVCASLLPFVLAVANPAAAAPSSSPPASSSAGSTLEDAVRNRLAVRNMEIIELTLPDRAGDGLTVTANLAGVERRLKLYPFSLRSPDFQMMQRDTDGKLSPAGPIPPPCTVRGTVEGLPGSVIAGSLADGQLDALIRLDPASVKLFCIQSAKALVPDAPAKRHIVYESSDVVSTQMRCGTDHNLIIEVPNEDPSPFPGSMAGGAQVADLAIEADYPFWQLNGSSSTTVARAVDLVLNLVDVMYRRDIDISYTFRFFTVWSTPDNYIGTNAALLLEQHRDNWDWNSSVPIRDVFHLMSGRILDSGVIGIAYQPGFCTPNLGYAYGLSAANHLGSLIERAAVTAHELGHNWSAGHCDGNPGCDIMCSELGGCEGNITSFTISAPIISFYRNSPSCAGLFGLPMATVWVDWRNPVYEQDGTPANPFTSVRVGYWRVEPGGTVSIANGTYPQSHYMQKPVTLVATGGSVEITGYSSRPAAGGLVTSPTTTPDYGR